MKSSDPPRKLSTCDAARLERFLSSDHYRIEDAELVAHLDACPDCRRSLETHAGDADLWHKASTLLKPCEFDQAGSQLYSAASGSLSEVGRQPVVIQDVLDSLAPTDNPQSLGRIGTYEVTGIVGVGGMGIVLKAIDPSLDRIVAIKVMVPRLANNETARKRFAREAKAAAAVLHPNVIAIHSVSSDKTLPYLVMAYIRGGSLQKRLEQQGPFPLVEILRIGAQIAAGLAAAHDQGLVHRDIKPENILLEEGVERVTITDFGLARAVDDNTVTQSGAIAGTPMYMSPEQARGDQVDQQSDLFSLGSVLYALCTGRPPYQGDSSYGVMRRIIDEAPRPIRELNPELPEWFVRIVEQLMARDKANRFASASEVHKLLETCLSHVQQPAAFPLPMRPGVAPQVGKHSFFKTRIGVLSMSILTAGAVICAALFALIDRPSLTVYGPNAPTIGDGKTDNAQAAGLKPSLIVERHERVGAIATGEVGTHRWKLKGQALGQLTVRILHIAGGKSRTVNECVYQVKTPDEQQIDVELKLELAKDPQTGPGRVFIPELAVSVNGLRGQANAGEKFVLQGQYQGLETVEGGALAAGGDEAIGYFAYGREKLELNRSVGKMLDASKDGAAFLVATVDWQGLDPALETKPDDHKDLQGTWQVTYSEDSGRVAPQELLKNLRMVITQEKMTMQIGSNSSEMTYKLDPSTSPKSIDTTERGRTKQGIYDLQGDTLRICFAEQSAKRPTAFDSKPNSANDVVIQMKRVTKAVAPEDKPPENNHSRLDVIKQLHGTWQAIYGEQAGAVISQKQVKQIQVQIDDDQFTKTDAGVNTDATFSVNLNTQPISIDLNPEDGDIVRGILDLRGNTLRLCTVQGKGERPLSFETQAGQRQVSLVILKRVVPHNAHDFSGDVNTEFYRRVEIGTANYPDGTLSLENAQDHLEAGGDTQLASVTSLSLEVATELAKTKADLWFSELKELKPEVLRALVQKRQGTLYLDSCERLFDGMAAAVGAARCPVSLSGVDWISAQDATDLAKGTQPLKLGLKEIDEDVARKLAQHSGWLVLSDLKQLDEAQATALAQHRARLSLNALVTISPEVAQALGKYDGQRLDLNGLAALDVETAQMLSAARCKEVLSLDGLKSITPEVIAALANGRFSISLQGVVVREIPTRRALDTAQNTLRAAGKDLVWGELIEEPVFSLGNE